MLKIEMTCRTCEFNFSGMCAAGDGLVHKYGDKIVDENDGCDAWSCGGIYFSKTIMKNKHLCKSCQNYKNEICYGVPDMKMPHPRKIP